MNSKKIAKMMALLLFVVTSSSVIAMDPQKEPKEKRFGAYYKGGWSARKSSKSMPSKTTLAKGTAALGSAAAGYYNRAYLEKMIRQHPYMAAGAVGGTGLVLGGAALWRYYKYNQKYTPRGNGCEEKLRQINNIVDNILREVATTYQGVPLHPEYFQSALQQIKNIIDSKEQYQ